MQENRIAMLAVIVENLDRAATVNALLHEYSAYVIGRMGIPVKERKLSLICVALDAPDDAVNSLCGKLGKLDGVSSKAIYSKLGA